MVEFCVFGYPGTSKERGTVVRLMLGKYECTCSFMLFATTKFKTIVVKEMEPNFVRGKVPELKKYLQVRRITFANKCRKERLDLSVKSHELPIEIRDDPGDWMGFSARMVTDD